MRQASTRARPSLPCTPQPHTQQATYLERHPSVVRPHVHDDRRGSAALLGGGHWEILEVHRGGGGHLQGTPGQQWFTRAGTGVGVGEGEGESQQAEPTCWMLMVPSSCISSNSLGSKPPGPTAASRSPCMLGSSLKPNDDCRCCCCSCCCCCRPELDGSEVGWRSGSDVSGESRSSRRRIRCASAASLDARASMSNASSPPPLPPAAAARSGCRRRRRAMPGSCLPISRHDDTWLVLAAGTCRQWFPPTLQVQGSKRIAAGQLRRPRPSDAQ